MFDANLIRWGLVLLLFFALPIALLRLMVYKTIETRDKHRR